MKKIKMPLVFVLAIMMVPMMAFAANGNSNGNANAKTISSQTTNGNSSNGLNSSSTGNQVQTQTQNQGEVGQIQTSTELQERINEAKPQYSPRNEQAQLHMSVVAKAVEALVRAADRMDDPGIGDQIREIARDQSRNQDEIDQGLDKIQQRTAFAYFFVGANYSEVKNIQGLMEQNRLKIQELEQAMAQIKNQADADEISAQIATLQNLQTSLQNQLKDLTGGFSLFGWLNRWMRGVTI